MKDVTARVTDKLRMDEADRIAYDLELEKEKLVNALSGRGATDEEYPIVVKNMREISEIQKSDIQYRKELNELSEKEINPNVVITIGGSILAILLILDYARLRALTSKG